MIAQEQENAALKGSKMKKNKGTSGSRGTKKKGALKYDHRTITVKAKLQTNSKNQSLKPPIGNLVGSQHNGWMEQLVRSGKLKCTLYAVHP